MGLGSESWLGFFVLEYVLCGVFCFGFCLLYGLFVVWFVCFVVCLLWVLFGMGFVCCMVCLLEVGFVRWLKVFLVGCLFTGF